MTKYIGQFPPKVAVILPPMDEEAQLAHADIWAAWLQTANGQAAVYIPKLGDPLKNMENVINIHYVEANLTPTRLGAIGSTLNRIVKDDLHYQWIIVLHDANTIPIQSAKSIIKNLARNRRSRFAFTTAPAPMFYRAHRPDFVLSRTHAVALGANTHIWGCERPLSVTIELSKNVINRPTSNGIQIGLPSDQYLPYAALTEIYGPGYIQEKINHGAKVVPKIADHILYGSKSWTSEESFVFECLTSGLEGTTKRDCCGIGTCSALPKEDKFSYDTFHGDKLEDLFTKSHFWFLGPVSPQAKLEGSGDSFSSIIIKHLTANI